MMRAALVAVLGAVMMTACEQEAACPEPPRFIHSCIVKYMCGDDVVGGAVAEIMPCGETEFDAATSVASQRDGSCSDTVVCGDGSPADCVVDCFATDERCNRC